MAEMESGARNRIRLWLRGERAFGLNAVPAAATRKETIVKTEPVEPVQRQETHERAKNPTSGGLFEDEGPPTKTSPLPPLVPLPIVEGFPADTLPTEEKRRRLIAMDAN